MNPTNPEGIALKFVECINNQDIEGLVSLMTADFTMIAYEGEPEIGRQRMKQGFKRNFNEYPEYQIHIEKVARSGNDIAIVGNTTGTITLGG